MTSTTDSTSTLALVTISPEYSAGPGSTRLEGEFFAARAGSPIAPPGYTTVIVHRDDPRSAGMWEVSSYGHDLTPYGLAASDHKGWNVPDRLVVDVDPDPEPPATGDRFAVDSRHTMTDGHRDCGPTIVTAHEGDALRVRHGCGISEATTRDYLTGNSTPLEPVAAPVAAPEPVAEESTPPEPYSPSQGDRVRVTGDTDSPSQQGKAATVLEVRPGSGIGRIRVRYDEGSSTSHTSDYGWWVDSVEPLLPATPEEFTALLERAREEGKAAGLEEGKAAGRAEVTREVDEWKRMATETAHEYARNNGLCSEFDRCMVAIGLEPRETYSRYVDVEVTYNVRVEVSGSELLGDEDDREAIALERAQEQISAGYVDPYSTDVDWD